MNSKKKELYKAAKPELEKTAGKLIESLRSQNLRIHPLRNLKEIGCG
jgi:hypothetical protein